MSSDRSTRENYLQSESQHGRLHFLISVNFDILLGFWFLLGGYNVNIHLYIIHFWNTLMLRKVQLPTDVSCLDIHMECLIWKIRNSSSTIFLLKASA